MTQRNKTLLLKSSLVIFAVVSLVYGIGYMFFPQTLVALQGEGAVVASGWLRWSGGVLIALGIGAFLTYKDLKKQDALVITFTLVSLFSGLALLYNLLFEITGASWFTALPAAVTLIVTALLWYARSQTRDLLKGNE